MRSAYARPVTLLRRLSTGLRRRLRRLLVRRVLGSAFATVSGTEPVRDHVQAFVTIYGVKPTAEQLETLVETVGSADPADPVGAWRRIVAAFDHHHAPTPFTIRFRPTDIAEVGVDGATLVIDTADLSVSQPIAEGTYEPHLVAFVRSFLQPGMTFVDVGANVGLYSILAAGLVGPLGRVVSVEPNSENCRLLLTSVARNRYDQIELHPVACGPAREHAVIRTALGSNGGFITGADDAVLDPTAMVVAVAQLDELVSGPVDLIKVDVEGAEALVFDGAERILSDLRPTVISEFSPEMLHRVSGIEALDYLQGWIDRRYTIHHCRRRTQELVPVPDPAAFLASYGSDLRIEDLVMRPQ